VKVREQGRVVSIVVVSAIGVRARSEREVLGLDVGRAKMARCGCSCCGAWWRWG
jgi:transposase-like protein